jgi:hypothetical protein
MEKLINRVPGFITIESYELRYRVVLYWVTNERRGTLYLKIQKMEEAYFSETSVVSYKFILCCNLSIVNRD